MTNTGAVREQDEPTLVEIVAAVVGVNPEELTDEDGPATVGAWTSRKQIELLVTLEEFYGLYLGQQEILGAPTIGALRELLRARRPG
jgi:acyl carrier protein